MKNLVFMAIVAITFSSCQKKTDEISPKSIDANSGTDNSSVNQSLDKAALIIARSLDDAALRSFIKTEAMKQFDGDYDILYKSVKSNTVNGQSLEGIFSSSAFRSNLGSGNFQSVISNVSNFQISIPVHCEKWNVEIDIPLVAISPTGANEKSLKQIKAYDSKGNVHYLSATVEPKVPVIVVGVSERVDQNGVLKYQFENPNASMVQRTSEQNTILGQIRVPDISTIESWVNGKPELRLRIYGAKLVSGKTTPSAVKITTKYYNPKRNDIDGVWYTVNTSLFNWYRYWPSTAGYVYGSEVKFYWVEEDSGTIMTVNVNLGGSIETGSGSASVSVSTSFDICDNDENLGDAIVAFIDPTSSYVYSVGELDFELD